MTRWTKTTTILPQRSSMTANLKANPRMEVLPSAQTGRLYGSANTRVEY
jgi:hypothetical protein